MIAALLLALQATPALPADWTQLPVIPWKIPPRYDSDMAKFVVDETKAGRCTAVSRDDLGYTLRVDLAVLVGPSGAVRSVTPRAIGCATVEQYAAGLVTRMVRDNLAAPSGDADAWYRASITFSWRP